MKIAIAAAVGIIAGISGTVALERHRSEAQAMPEPPVAQSAVQQPYPFALSYRHHLRPREPRA
ncbi:MAG: hypothetical protein ACLPX1_13130 [Steroidobacteraceae bacterium]